MNLREANIERLSEIQEIASRGMPSFKFYMTYDSYKVPDDVLFAACRRSRGSTGSRSCTPRTTS